MTESHDLALAGHGLIEVARGLIRSADLLEHGQDIFVGPAMKRASQRADGGSDNRIRIGEGTGGDAGTEGAGIETVLRVQDQALIKDP